MKNIVVGIDFSNNSLNSLKHAISISLRTGASMHLVWVKTPGMQKNIQHQASPEDMMSEAHALLQKLLQECRHEAPASPAQSVILDGKPYLELPKYAANLPESMIVIGTHGNSGFEEKFVGSNAFKTASISRVPVLVLREGISVKRDLTQVLVPIDTSFETLQKVKPAIHIAKAFNAKVLLAGFYFNQQEKHIVSIQMDHADVLCTKANIRHDRVLVKYKKSPITSLVDCAVSNDVNLMVIMRENEQDDSLWMGNGTRQLMINTPMPLLIIPNVHHTNSTK
ncbi:MAG: universal stress protein [Bacteroidales bacterium]|nr:universal stress protein [Bacteroidales bacterium]